MTSALSTTRTASLRWLVQTRSSLQSVSGGGGGRESEPARLLATPVEIGNRVVVVLVGESLEDRDDALDGLLAQLLVVLSIALLVSAGVGFLDACAALRRGASTVTPMRGRSAAGHAHEREFVANASHEISTPLALLQTDLAQAMR